MSSFAATVVAGYVPPVVTSTERVRFLLAWSGFDVRVDGEDVLVACAPDLRPSSVEAVAHILKRDLVISDAGDCWRISLGARR